MAEELNKNGVQIPSIGRIVHFLTEVTSENISGKTWPAIITEVVSEDDMQVRLTAFPPGEPARGIEAVVPCDVDRMLNHTWSWPPRV